MVRILISTLLLTGLTVNASADDEEKRLQEMLVDIGGHENIARNNGKSLKCIDRGNKRITIKQKNSLSMYRSEYNNCRENGSVRDGIFEMVVKDGEVLESHWKRTKNGELFDAVQNGDVKKARNLIKRKSDVNYTEGMPTDGNSSIEEWTPLMSAVMSGNLEMVKLLLRAGAWVNYNNSLGVTALWIAANRGDVEIARHLISNKAYVNNVRNDGVTPLVTAAMAGHYDTIKLLVASGADVNIRPERGDSALMHAVATGRSDIASLLLDAGAEVNVQNQFGISPLIIAAAEGNVTMAERLVARNADITLRTDEGKTALDIATAKGFTQIVELLRLKR